MLSKIALLELFQTTACQCSQDQQLQEILREKISTYRQIKGVARQYQTAKHLLQGDGPFIGWVKSGNQWEDFAATCPQTV